MPIRPYFHIAFVKNVVFYAESHGVAAERLCQRAGISSHLLLEPDAVVDARLMERVWDVAVEETGDANLGLHLGAGIEPAAIGVLGLAMMSCDTLQTALLKLIRYWDLMSNATRIELFTGKDKATIELRVIDVPGNFLFRNRHPVDSSYSACLSLLQAMAGQPVRLLNAETVYPPPFDVQEHVRVLGVRPRFGAGANTMTFPAEVMRWPLRYFNPALVQTLEKQMLRRVKQNPVTLQDRVRLELVHQIRANVPDLGAIASSLGVSERAMQRELQSEGTTFRKVVDDLRKDLAAEYLADSQHSIADISFLLGFSEPSVLHRYFRRWYGETPATYRSRRGGPVPESESRLRPPDSTTPTT
jgi:AraC-like DNA-binding protein